MRDYVIEQIKKNKVIAIVRGIDAEKCLEVARALYAGGIRLMELTYDQSHPGTWETTAGAIGAIAKEFDGRLLAGAGTVTNTKLVELTRDHGGLYTISPNTDPSVIARTRELGMVSIPGAMTPTEILAAHNAGADFVKLFPASELGIGYLKAVRAPISHVDILATGGITEKNAKAFLEAGAAGLGVGGMLARKDAIESGEYCRLTEAAETLLASIS